MAAKSLCKIDGCDKPVYGYGWCNGHYHRWKRGVPIAETPLREKRHGKDPWGWLRDHVDYRGDDCLIWPFALQAKGYASIRLNGNSTTASRMMCRMAHGEPPSPEYDAAHSCGNGRGGCVHPRHLRWATVIENQQDRTAHAMDCPGERNGRVKLSEEDVRRIRSLRGKARQVDLAKEYGVIQGTISAIQTGRLWKHLD